jgi:hypothetical protein
MKTLGLVYGKDGTQKQKIQDTQTDEYMETDWYTKRLVHRKMDTWKGRYTERLVHGKAGPRRGWYIEKCLMIRKAYYRSVLRITNPLWKNLRKSKLFPKLPFNPALLQTFTGDRKVDICSGSVVLEVIKKGNQFVVTEIVLLKLEKLYCFFSSLW